MIAGGLVALGYRRALPLAAAVLFAALAALVATRSWSPPAALPLEPDALGDLAALERAHARQGVWAVLLCVALPFSAWRAAALARGWYRDGADWLASRAPGAAHAWSAGVAGSALAAASLVTLSAAAAELAAGGSAPAHRWSRSLPVPPAMLHPGDASVSWGWKEGVLPPGAAVRVSLGVGLGSGPAVDVRLSLERAGVVAERARRIASRTPLVVPVPPGAGPVWCELARESDGALVLLRDDAAELLAPARSERLTSWVLAAHALLFAAAWCALAVGLGAWLRPSTCVFLLASLWLPAWLGDAHPAVWPGGELPRALALVGEGLVPPGPAPAAWAGLAVAAAAGLAAAAPALRRAR